ncbi:MAG: hypothetical protein JSV76_01005 [Candidatus Bathyarchaeota archaeon]|nr:MAG: hypothetical protein JSV76_01005 [Candidatus Bathyarchaeota archaeon]
MVIVSLQKKRLLIVNAIFATTALNIERIGIALDMYVYNGFFLNIFGVPLLIIAYWVMIGHTSWVAYKKLGWTMGLLTGILIDLPFEILSFHLGWWTWIPSWSPAIFFEAPIINFGVYFLMSLGSILTYRYVMNNRSMQLHVD